MFDLIGFTIALALGSAITDSIVIKGRIVNGDRRDLDHGALAAIRALLFIAYACWMCYDGMDPWRAVLVSPACAVIFATVHRVTLNLLRGLDWRYMSPSNWYDYLFLICTRAWWWKPKNWSSWSNWFAFMRHCHTGCIELDYEYKCLVHRAGLLAYIFEAVVAAVFIYLATLLA